MNEKEYREFADNNFIPIIREESGKILIEKIKQINPKNILEIGTAMGFSGVLMLENSNANLTTLEKDEKMKNLALKNFEKENLISRVNLIFGDAFDFIENCKEKFDFIFLDGPKGQYLKYIPYLINSLNENGLIFCDNVLFQGLVLTKIVPPKKHRTIVNNLRKFLDYILNREDLQVELLKIEDGIALIKKT